MTFHVGDIWEPVTTISDPKTKGPADPTTVQVTVTPPTGIANAPLAMTKVVSGEYTARINLTEPGRWHAAVVTTGEWQGSKPESITVKPA
jgi:hypothetical protein